MPQHRAERTDPPSRHAADDTSSAAASTPPAPAPSVRTDVVAILVGVGGAILTFAQLEPARAALATVAIAAVVAAFLTHRHVRDLPVRSKLRTAWAAIAVLCLVMIQTVASSATNPRPVTDPTPSVRASTGTANIAEGDSRPFLDGDIHVGVQDISASSAVLTLATDSGECSGTARVGQSLVISDSNDRWIRVQVRRIRSEVSVTVQVARGSGDVPMAQDCS